jgi:hypothetical protein
MEILARPDVLFRGVGFYGLEGRSRLGKPIQGNVHGPDERFFWRKPFGRPASPLNFVDAFQ